MLGHVVDQGAREQRQRHDQDQQQDDADQGGGEAAAMAQSVAELAEAAVDRDRDHHPPDDRHQERLGDREAPEHEQQQQPNADDDFRRGARNGEVATFAGWRLHGPSPSEHRVLGAGGGQTAAEVKAPLRADVVAGEA